MRIVLGEDACRTFRMPAPWGSLVLTEALDSLWQIDVDFERVDAPDAMPASLTRWANALEHVLTCAPDFEADFYRDLFALPRAKELTDFSAAVLREVAGIALGTFRTYGEIASSVKTPSASRAVGQVLASNPFLILIPCHRVASSEALARFDMSEPKTFEPTAYRGHPEFAPIGAWLRLHDIACANEN